MLWGLLVAVVVLGAAGARVWQVVSPTHGPRIAAGLSTKRAVIVVDVQEDYTGPSAKKPYASSTELIARINEVLERAKVSGAPVLLVRNEVSASDLLVRLLSENTTVRGTPGVELDRRLAAPLDARVFAKTCSDSFSSKELDACLREQRVSEVVIVGLDAAFCVSKTARGALNRGYGVTLLTDAIATSTGRPVAQVLEPLRTAGATLRPFTAELFKTTST